MSRNRAGRKERQPERTAIPGVLQVYRAEEMEQASEEAITDAVKAPHSNPPFELTQAEIDDLIAYLKSLADRYEGTCASWIACLVG